MVIKKPFQTWAAALMTAALAVGAHADTITLKDGTKIEGKVQSENDKEVVIEEQVSASITDSRTVPKADIAKIDKTSQDEPAFQAIKSLKPGVNSLPAASYDQILRSLNNFVSTFPESAHVPEVKQQITAWEEEKKRVTDGEMKFSNRWLSKEEAQKERYQLNGQAILSHMQQQYRQGDLAGALNSFDQFEKSYAGARSFPDAVDLAKQILPALKATADRTLQQAKYQQAEREKGVQLLSEPQRSQTIAAIQREKQQATAAAEAASKAGLKWPPLVPVENTLTSISAKVPDELRRLNELPVAKMRQSIQLAEKARGLVSEKKFDEADQALRDALQQWSANELATRLQTEATTLKTASASAPAEEAPAAPEPAPAEGEAKPVLTTAPAANAETPASSTVAAATEGSTAAVLDAESEEPGFFKTPAGIVTAIILSIIVLTLFFALRKISKRASEVIE